MYSSSGRMQNNNQNNNNSNGYMNNHNNHQQLNQLSYNNINGIGFMTTMFNSNSNNDMNFMSNCNSYNNNTNTNNNGIYNNSPSRNNNRQISNSNSYQQNATFSNGQNLNSNHSLLGPAPMSAGISNPMSLSNQSNNPNPPISITNPTYSQHRNNDHSLPIQSADPMMQNSNFMTNSISLMSDSLLGNPIHNNPTGLIGNRNNVSSGIINVPNNYNKSKSQSQHHSQQKQQQKNKTSNGMNPNPRFGGQSNTNTNKSIKTKTSLTSTNNKLINLNPQQPTKTSPPKQDTAKMDYLQKLKNCMEANKRNINATSSLKKYDTCQKRLSVDSNDCKNLKRNHLSLVSSDIGMMESEQAGKSTDAEGCVEICESLKGEENETKKMCTFSTILSHMTEKTGETDGSEMMDCPMVESCPNDQSECSEIEITLESGPAIDSCDEKQSGTKKKLATSSCIVPTEKAKIRADRYIIAVNAMLTTEDVEIEASFELQAFYCKLCSWILNDEQSVKQHMYTILHRNKVAALKKS